jgi:hypothetical protein
MMYGKIIWGKMIRENVSGAKSLTGKFRIRSLGVSLLCRGLDQLGRLPFLLRRYGKMMYGKIIWGKMIKKNE